MKTLQVPVPGRIMLAIAALPCWVVLVLGVAPVFFGEPAAFGAEAPVFLLMAGALTAIVITGRVPVLD